MSDTPTGRPLIQIDMTKLAALMRLDPKREDAAAIMGCSVDTVERRIKEETGLTYMEFKDQHLANTRISLAQQAIKEAMAGNTQMLIFCLKHHCGWTDRGEASVQVNVQNNIEQNVKVEAFDLEDRIKQLKGDTDEKA